MRADRRRREHPDPFLDWKLRIFFGGAALLIAAMLVKRDTLALVAIVVLLVGVGLMAWDRVRARRHEAPPPEDEPLE